MGQKSNLTLRKKLPRTKNHETKKTSFAELGKKTGISIADSAVC